MADRLKLIRQDRIKWVAGETLELWQIMDFDELLAMVDAKEAPCPEEYDTVQELCEGLGCPELGPEYHPGPTAELPECPHCNTPWDLVKCYECGLETQNKPDSLRLGAFPAEMGRAIDDNRRAIASLRRLVDEMNRLDIGNRAEVSNHTGRLEALAEGKADKEEDNGE